MNFSYAASHLQLVKTIQEPFYDIRVEESFDLPVASEGCRLYSDHYQSWVLCAHEVGNQSLAVSNS